MGFKKEVLKSFAGSLVAGAVYFGAVFPANRSFDTRAEVSRGDFDLSPLERIIEKRDQKVFLSLENVKKSEYFLLKEKISNYLEDSPRFFISKPRKGYSSEEIVREGSGYVSFYRPGEASGLGGPDITASGLRISDAVESEIPLVAGSCRLGVPIGNALYELENPENGNKAIVYVADKFGESTLKKNPERMFDIVSDSYVPEALGFEGNPSNPDSFGVKKVRFRYLGKIK